MNTVKPKPIIEAAGLNEDRIIARFFLDEADRIDRGCAPK